MNEIEKELAEQIEMWVARNYPIGNEDFNDLARAILSLETKTHRIAVIKKVGELPDKLMIPFYLDPKYAMASKAGQSVGKTAKMAYRRAQEDMIEAGYVQESSDKG